MKINSIKNDKIIIYLAVIVGIVFRIIPIWLRDTWYDENFSIILARLPWNEMMAATAADVHPPLWYIICWLFARIDFLPGWAICRIPALVASLLSIYVFWLVLKSLWFISPRWQTAAMVLFCLMPSQIYYAQEGRQYALLTLLVLITWYSIIKLDYNWWGFGKYRLFLFLSLVGILYLHNYGIIYFVVLLAAGIIYNIYRKLYMDILVMLWTATLAFICYIPWIGILLSQMESIHGIYWMVHLTPQSFLIDIAESFFTGETSLNNRILDLAVFWFFIGWNIYTIIKDKKHSVLFISSVLVLAFGPATIAAIGSIIWKQPILLNRALLPSTPFMALLMAYIYPKLSLNKTKLILALIVFLPAFVVNLGITINRHIWPSWDSIKMAAILEKWRPGDLIFYNDDSLFVSGKGLGLITDEMDLIRITPCGYTRGGLTENTRMAIGETTGLIPSSYEADRTWIVLMETPLSPTCESEYFRSLGLFDNNPLVCAYNNKLVKACVYLVDHGN